MTRTRDSLILGLTLDQHGRLATWRDTSSAPLDRIHLPTHIALAQAAEDAGFNFVFLADVLRFQPSWGNRGILGGTEPITLLSALAGVTDRIGLVGSISTTFNHPYTVARQLASLDQLSDGRAGWNIVTSYDGERNYGLTELPNQAERYARAEEFLDVTTALWESWGTRHPVGEPLTERFSIDRIHPINHHGRYFDVEGPADIQPPIQPRPVIFQAGASSVGKDFAARRADVVFAAAQHEDHLTSFTSDLAHRATAAGRGPGTPAVLPGLTIYLAETDELARREYRALIEAADIGVGVRGLSQLLDVNLTVEPLDAPIDPNIFPSYSDAQSRRQSRPELFASLAAQGYSLRRLVELFLSTHGHREVVGSARTVADEIQRWSTGTDGFIVSLGFGPPSAALLRDELAPELRRRGLISPPPSSGITLREALLGRTAVPS
ncbi:MAG: NtaA/DmoA family FMN-dependent monooxygenase [Gordonia sp. (in: high G+C Gram-positive bacteria)]